MENLPSQSGPTFAKDDKLSLQSFCAQLEQFILTERDYVEGSLVISLNAPFGAGKSTFIGMWRNSLLERCGGNTELPLPIMLNAWEDDHSGDPLVAIISSLSSQLAPLGFPTEKIATIREAAKDAFWFGLGVANSVIAKTTGADVLKGADLAEKKKTERAKTTANTTDVFAAFERRRNALQHLRSTLEEVFKDRAALILVDELDRCRPDYGVQFLEAVKHLFFSKNVSFVLAVDKRQLRASACALFGSDLQFDEYYRKFAHRNVNLPEPTPEKLDPLIRSCYERFTRAESRKTGTSHFRDDGDIFTVIQTMVVGMNMTPRQIQELFRVLGHVMTAPAGKKPGIHWGYRASAILLAGYSITNPDFYHKWGNGRVPWSEIVLSLDAALPNRNVFVWMLMLVISGGASGLQSNKERIEKFPLKNMKEFADEAALQAELQGYSQAWGLRSDFGSKSFMLPYEYLESLRRFTE